MQIIMKMTMKIVQKRIDGKTIKTSQYS